jgi:uncharacterized protein (DUF433 family)
MIEEWLWERSMIDSELLQRITVNPDVLTGKPVVRGTRLSVDFVLNLMSHGSSMDEIVAEYPGVEIDDLRACFLFAARSLQRVS